MSGEAPCIQDPLALDCEPAVRERPAAGPEREESERAEMIMHLERDQLVAETNRPLPRAQLTRPTLIALWALRVFVLVLSVMVIYTFIALLH